MTDVLMILSFVAGMAVVCIGESKTNRRSSLKDFKTAMQYHPEDETKRHMRIIGNRKYNQ